MENFESVTLHLASNKNFTEERAVFIKKVINIPNNSSNDVIIDEYLVAVDNIGKRTFNISLDIRNKFSHGIKAMYEEPLAFRQQIRADAVALGSKGNIRSYPCYNDVVSDIVKHIDETASHYLQTLNHFISFNELLAGLALDHHIAAMVGARTFISLLYVLHMQGSLNCLMADVQAANFAW
jgi:hypothetical protein